MNQDMRVVVEALGVYDFIDSLRRMNAIDLIRYTSVAFGLFGAFLALAIVG